MPETVPTVLTRLHYEKAAQSYLRSLPLEHYKEALPQGTQRKITLESMDLVHAARPAVQTFNEMLVQYPKPKGKIGQVVPDNMVAVHDHPLRVAGSYDTIYQPVAPFWVMEYVSKSSERKDYDDNMQKYERDLKVPYYLLFYPDNEELTLFRHGKKLVRYLSVKPNRQGRLALPELDMEVALLGGWTRFWFKGELLPLPADLQRDLTEARRHLTEARHQLHAMARENEQLRGEVEQSRHAHQTLEEDLSRLRAERKV